MPKVSVIVPNYNHGHFLRQRLDSVLGQTFQDFEVILLDDCSTDESRSIISEYANDSRIRTEFNEVNSGSTFKQWNKGVRQARGEYVWIAESDDYADRRLLERLVARLDAEPGAVLCYCRSRRVSGGGEIRGFLDSSLADLDAQRWTTDYSADGREECRNYLVRRNTVQGASSVVFRREVYQRVGGADESLVLCGDWKIWAAMALTGGTIAHVEEPLNYHRFHASSVTEKSVKDGVWAAEALQVVPWIMQRATPEQTTLEDARRELSGFWIAAAINRRIPAGFRWKILKDAAAVDPHALRRLFRALPTALRMTLARRWRSWRTASPAKSDA